MLLKTEELLKVCREKGVACIHCPLSFDESMNDNPNKGFGLLNNVVNRKLSLRGSWNTEFYDQMKPVDGEVVITSKRGLDAFVGTDLEEVLMKLQIETVILSGFLTNGCVESTMRTAYEKGFNVITLKDCCSTTSLAGQSAATEGTFTFFSTPLTKDELLGQLS